MSANPDILLVAQEPHATELGSRMKASAVADPYDALREMARRRWSTVVLAEADRELPALCRAARRLQKDSRVVALCPVTAEPQLRPLVGTALDDYNIYPPTRRDLDALCQPAPPAPAGPARSALSGSLSPREFSALVESARHLDSLETTLANLIGSHLKVPVIWQDANRLNPDTQSLLLLAGDAPRVLVAHEPLDPWASTAAAPLLSTIQDCLPSLAEAAQRCQSLHELAITDHLTGAYNRRYFYTIVDRILTRAAQHNSRAMLLLYDIDDFKRYNDTYGHAAGDEILRETAALMKKTSRAHDIVARIGGDEFAVLFWEADNRPRVPNSRPIQAIYDLAERFRRAVRQHRFSSLGPDARGSLTISGGLAVFPRDGSTRDALLRAADKALREAKTAGKDSIHLIGGKDA